ncbi:hypothetical protein PMAG_a0675 [Pseudoalteromonas mariniglutinosa NCIMB 1770]|nr:hypothetical protein [Pseudoalteromonas mariniglutinosa NCIMB 1770]
MLALYLARLNGLIVKSSGIYEHYCYLVLYSRIIRPINAL